MASLKLFAVYLGGHARKANTELHDIVFVTGRTLEETYDQLLDKWFGLPRGLHVDSWMELDVVDGHRITLSKDAASGENRLWFVNLGAYRKDQFAEFHATGFYAAPTAVEAKKRARAELFRDGATEIHKDDLHDVDDCIALGKIGNWHIVLTKTGETSVPRPNNGYHIIPKPVIAAWLAKQS